MSKTMEKASGEMMGILERAARASDESVERIQDAQAAISMNDPIAAAEALTAANEVAQAAYLLLLSTGVKAPAGSPAPVPVPLHLLDTPATRRMLDAFQFLVTCAGDVDRERGHTLPDGTGTGWTDSVGDLYELFRQQVQGPRGKE